MSITQRRFLGLFFSALTALVLTTTPTHTFANNYPTKPITIITPVAPGSPFDQLTRLFAERLGRKLKTTVVIENATGGQAMVATKKVLNAPADGYTLFMTSSGLATTPLIVKDAGYVLDDFTPIAPLGQAPYIFFVSSSMKATDIPSLMKEIKERGRSLNHGVLTSSHLSVVLSKKMAATAGGEPYEEIGYKGSPQMSAALLADDVQMIGTTYSIIGPHLKGGKVKAIGVLGRERSVHMPELKTFIESGYEDIYINVWSALYAKAAIPKDIADKLRTASAEIIADPSYRAAMLLTGCEFWPIRVEDMQPAFYKEAAIFKRDMEKFKLKFD